MLQLGVSMVSRQRIFTDNIHLAGKLMQTGVIGPLTAPHLSEILPLCRRPLGGIQGSVRSLDVCEFSKVLYTYIGNMCGYKWVVGFI